MSKCQLEGIPMVSEYLRDQTKTLLAFIMSHVYSGTHTVGETQTNDIIKP